MKKQFFFMAAATIALASCTSEEVVEVNNGNAIGFRVAMGAETNSRGAEMTTEKLDEFNVTAFVNGGGTYFENVTFTKANNVFTSTTSYYWPTQKLDFYAYNPTSISNDVTFNDAGNLTLEFTPEAVVADQIDLVVASATEQTEPESGSVALTFGHQLSQIEIYAKNENEGYKYTVAGYRIGGVAKSGTLTYTAGETTTSSWSIANNAEKTYYGATFTAITLGETAQLLSREGTSLAANDTETASAQSDDTEVTADNAMLIPQQLTAWNYESEYNDGAYIAVLIKIETAEGTQIFPPVSTNTDADVAEYLWVAVAINTNWEAGKKYSYTLDFSKGAGVIAPNDYEQELPEGFDPSDPILGNAISFTVTEVTAWGNPVTENVTFQKESDD